MGGISAALGVLLAVYLLVLMCWRNYRKGFTHVGSVLATNLILLALTVILFRFATPVATNYIIFQLAWGHIFFLLPISAALLLSLYVGWRTGWDPTELDGMSLVYIAAAIIILVGGAVLLESGKDNATCQTFGFKRVDKIVDVDPKAIRFTPLTVAHKDMIQTLVSSEFTVMEKLTDPIDVDGRFGYVTPITPSGAIVTFLAKNNGFMIFDDGPDIAPGKNVRRTSQEFEVGEEMEWTDNIYWRLYQDDFWCEYPEVHYLQLDPDNPDKLTAVAPKIVYRYYFPFYLVPEWGGVTLVDEHGVIEKLSVDQAQTDPRLVGKRIFPESLAREYVENQIYDQGFLSGWYKREGKIEIPTLPGPNQMPYFTRAMDGHSYFVVATEPTGEAYALFRLYYVDVYNGQRTFFECDMNKGLLGPVKAIERVLALQGYKWVEDEGSSGEAGNFRVVESVYLSRDGVLYWKYTITTKSYTGVVATAVVNAETHALVELKTRPEFYDWLNRKPAQQAAPELSPANVVTREPHDGAPMTELARIRALLEEALQRISALENR